MSAKRCFVERCVADVLSAEKKRKHEMVFDKNIFLKKTDSIVDEVVCSEFAIIRDFSEDLCIALVSELMWCKLIVRDWELESKVVPTMSV